MIGTVKVPLKRRGCVAPAIMEVVARRVAPGMDPPRPSFDRFVTRPSLLGVMLLTASATILGCATPNGVVYSPVNAPPRAFVRRAPASVEVVVGKPPTRPHVDVGMFEVYQGRQDDDTGRSTEDMLTTLRLHAALRGCDAVQVMGVELAGGDRRESRVVRGVCEMYTDAEAIEADKKLTPERLPSEGQACVVQSDSVQPGNSAGQMSNTAQPGNTALSSNSAPVSDALTSCPYPLVCSAKGVCMSPYQ
jgi:hypothetical protein